MRRTNNNSITRNNRSASNLLSKRTKEYQKYVKEQAKNRGNIVFEDQLKESSTSNRLKSKINQNQESVNRISRTLAPILGSNSPNIEEL